MRLLMISDVYFPRVNGVSTSIQTVSRELLALGHEVTLLAPDYGEGYAEASGEQRGAPVAAPADAEPFDVIRIPSRYLFFDPEDRMMRWLRIRALRAQLSAGGFDLVHIHTPFVAHYAGVAIARWLSVPVVESYHTFFEQYLDKYVTFLPGAWMRYAARSFSAAQCNDVDALVVPSRAMLEVLERYGIRTPAEVVPTGIELEQFAHGDGARFRRVHGIAPDRPLLVHVGRLAFEKNCDFLLRMLVHVKAELPDVLLVIAGGGPARRQLEALTRRLGLQAHVRFIGYLNRDGSLEDCYAAGDAFVFASLTETQGLVLLESMALGTPVVAIAEMGTREVLSQGDGCLIAPYDEVAFAAHCLRLLADRALRSALSARAVRYAQAWSAPVLVQRLLKFYQRALAARGGPLDAAETLTETPTEMLTEIPTDIQAQTQEEASATAGVDERRSAAR
jgi:glycosyltransferase involved in cell wall biosynthesis